MTAPYIQALAQDGTHRFSKQPVESLKLLTGLGVEGDAHAGVTVKHRSRVARDPSQPNLRQLHLLHAEIFDELAPQGFALQAGDIGENVTTRGLDLLALGAGTRLCLGTEAVVEITGLRNPCAQLDHFQAGVDGGDARARCSGRADPQIRCHGHSVARRRAARGRSHHRDPTRRSASAVTARVTSSLQDAAKMAPFRGLSIFIPV
jgi:hypothetical protein